jgi:hypothetical protein
MADLPRFKRKPKPIPEGEVLRPGAKAKREQMARVNWQRELAEKEKEKSRLAQVPKDAPAPPPTMPPRLSVVAWRAETYARLASMFRSIKGPLDQERVNRVRNRPTP